VAPLKRGHPSIRELWVLTISTAEMPWPH